MSYDSLAMMSSIRLPSESMGLTSLRHLGPNHIRTVQDSFKIQGPMGPHMCLVYEPMREPLWLFQRRMSGGVYCFDLLGYTVKFLLIGLDYLNNECKVIHTGVLRPEVILGAPWSYPADIWNLATMRDEQLHRNCWMSLGCVALQSKCYALFSHPSIHGFQKPFHIQRLN